MTLTKVTARDRKVVNRKMGRLGLAFHDSPGLALASILDVLAAYGLAFELMYQPKTGRTVNVLRRDGREVANSLLVVETHEMQTGRIELNAYLS